jgi:S-formylglutathione hydrolase
MGQAASFYLDATNAPWAAHYQMRTWLIDELPGVIAAHFPADMTRQGITGHSMGGHGALTLALRHPGRFASVSAFAPIAHPSASDWALKALHAYLGTDEATLARHDATLLLRETGFDGPMLIDQGAEDPFLDALMPEALAGAMAARRQHGSFRMQAGYDHSYFFVASFMGGHMDFHAEALG